MTLALSPIGKVRAIIRCCALYLPNLVSFFNTQSHGDTQHPKKLIITRSTSPKIMQFRKSHMTQKAVPNENIFNFAFKIVLFSSLAK